jgi:DNA-binding transcriptional LysR family regulator
LIWRHIDAPDLSHNSLFFLQPFLAVIVDIRDLRYFIAAAELCQLRQAAERVGRSQPALTKCIHRLENELGKPLFERQGHRLTLTAVGEALLVRARTVAQTMDAAIREVSEIADGIAGHLRIGCGTTAAEWLMPGLFSLMLQRFPKLTFDVEINLGDRLRQMLRDGDLDLFIGALDDKDYHEFEAIDVATDNLVVAVSPAHRLAGRRVRIQDLTDERWLIPGPLLGSTQWLNHVFENHGLPRPHIQVQVSTVVLMRRVISNTSLLTFISRRDVGNARSSWALREVRVPEASLKRKLGILRVRERYLPEAAYKLINLAQNEARTILALSRRSGSTAMEEEKPHVA